jgi:hypothetical protein
VVSVKVTLPVGVPPLPETVAVNVTGCGNVLEPGADETSVVVVAVWACAVANDSSDIAHASAAAPITRRTFRRTRDLRSKRPRSARANARPACCIVFT